MQNIPHHDDGISDNILPVVTKRLDFRYILAGCCLSTRSKVIFTKTLIGQPLSLSRVQQMHDVSGTGESLSEDTE